MSKMTIYILRYCGYCRRALKDLDELQAEHPEFSAIEIEQIDENTERERAARMDYYLVPTFYCGDQKLHEGAINKTQLETVLRRCLEHAGKGN